MTAEPSFDVVDGATFDIADPTNGVQPFSMSLEGLEGTGKTYFSLMTTPLPVVHVNFSDRDATHFLYDMCEERRKATRLYSFKAKTTAGWTREEGRESLQGLSDIAKKELGDNKLHGGTFVIDSGSSWWEVVQDCYVAPLEEQRALQGDKKIGGIVYAQANLVVKGLVNWLKNQGAFVILTHQLAQEWDAKGPVTGAYRARQNSQVPYMVDVRLRLSMTCNKCGGKECMAENHIGRTHFAHLMKFGKQSGFIGTTLPSPTMSTIYAMYSGRQLKGVPEDVTN